MTNEIQRMYWNSQLDPVDSGNVEAGTFKLVDQAANASSALNYNDSAATVQAALEALAGIGVGNVTVTLESNGYSFEFIGALANTALELLQESESSSLRQKADSINVVVTTSGVAAVNEVQQVDFGGATGAFDLNGNATSATVATLDSGGLLAACETIWGMGNVNVSGSGPFDVTFQNALAGTNVGEMTVSNITDGSPTVTTTTQGVAGVPQVVTVTTPDSPTQGSLTVTIGMDTSASFNATDLSAGALTGWTVGGSAGNWTYTRDVAAANEATVSGAEAGVALRKAVTIEIVEVQNGVAVASSSPSVFGSSSGFNRFSSGSGFKS